MKFNNKDYTIRFYEVRAKFGYTLKQIEEKTGVSKTTWNDIENGYRSPTLDTLVQVAKSLDIKITDLFDSEYK